MKSTNQKMYIKPLISVLMSSYNDEKFIDESVQSILNQSFSDFEFLIINDGSTDNTLKIMQRYTKQDKRIILINNKRNLGFIKSLNKGLKKAKGKYIARMDADDVALPNRLQIQFDYLEQNTDIFMAGTYAINMDENGTKISLFKPPTNPKMIAKSLETYNCMYHNTIMFRNSGEYFYREKMTYTEDNDLYLRFLSDGKKIANIPILLVKYRRSPNSTSFSKRGKQMLFSQKAREFYFQRQKYGKDEYNSFKPTEILNIDIENSTNKLVLVSEIIVKFAVLDLKATRKLILKYYENYGLFNKPTLLLYFFATYMNKKLLKIVKTIILIILRRY
jgi:glycosyltransferase involved in cell wall biosynthesis